VAECSQNLNSEGSNAAGATMDERRFIALNPHQLEKVEPSRE
jgi:hypothetical protein